jgi:hypothetical protein
MLSSRHTTRQPSHSSGLRKRSTSGGSKIAVSLNSDSRYQCQFFMRDAEVIHAKIPINHSGRTKDRAQIFLYLRGLRRDDRHGRICCPPFLLTNRNTDRIADALYEPS